MKKRVLLPLLLAGLAVLGCSEQSFSANKQNNSARTEADVSAQVPAQMRGYIVYDVPAIAADIIKADDTVDVLFTFQAQLKDGTKSRATVTLLQNVKVLKVGTGKGTNAEKAYLVLALSPRDAQYLALAQAEGILSFVLRTEGDTTSYLLELATFEKLFQ